MLTKEEVLKELPLRKREGAVVTFAEFLDLKRMAESLKLGEDGLSFVKREVVARRERLGLVAGMQHPPKTAEW